MQSTSITQLSDTYWVRTAVQSYEAPLTRYAQRILGDAEQARDVVQETFVRLCRTRPAEVNGHLAAWLFTVCRNQALSVRRKEDRMVALTEVMQTDLASPELEPGVALQRRETAHSLRECLQRLPPNQQAVIKLKFQEGLSYQQIADTTGLSLSNVGFLIHRGLKSLRQHMQGEE